MRRRALTTMIAGVAALGLAGCETYDDPGYGPHGGYGPPPPYAEPGPGFGDYGYHGQEFDPRMLGPSPFRGPGAQVLDPWLAHTQEGWRIVTTGFRGASQGWIDVDTAHRVNVWFRRYADTDRNMKLTDAEIRVALVQASRDHRWMQRVPPPRQGPCCGAY